MSAVDEFREQCKKIVDMQSGDIHVAALGLIAWSIARLAQAVEGRQPQQGTGGGERYGSPGGRAAHAGTGQARLSTTGEV